MTTIVGPSGTAPIVVGPVSQILPPQYRFAGDDWADVNAFVFTFYSVVPTFDQNGNQLTPGTLQNLAGCTFSGALNFTPSSVQLFPNRVVPPMPPIPMVGTINVQAGQGTLTLSSSITGGPAITRQDPGVWANAMAGDTSGALGTVQARLTDSLGMTGTVAVIPLYVF